MRAPFPRTDELPPSAVRRRPRAQRARRRPHPRRDRPRRRLDLASRATWSSRSTRPASATTWRAPASSAPKAISSPRPSSRPLRPHARARGRRGARSAGEEILEIGAGSGALAASLLEELERLGRLPQRYLILEALARAARAQPRHARCARAAPDGARGVAERAPARGIRLRHRERSARRHARPRRAHVAGRDRRSGRRRGRTETRSSGPTAPPRARSPARRGRSICPAGYTTEIGLVASAFVASLARTIERGVALFVDYGFPRREYYHPQRTPRHADVPLPPPRARRSVLPARAAGHHGARRLHRGRRVGAGSRRGRPRLHDAGAAAGELRHDRGDVARSRRRTRSGTCPLAGAANKLTSPSEMGELFKAIAFGRGVADDLAAFRSGDRRQAL